MHHAGNGVPNTIDVHVGGRIRVRRKLLNMSQSDLAHALGLTSQQIEQYEAGAKRVSSSRLHEISRALTAPISFFFHGLTNPDADGGETTSSGDETLAACLAMPDAIPLLKAFSRVRTPSLRRRLIALISSVADRVDGEATGGDETDDAIRPDVKTRGAGR